MGSIKVRLAAVALAPLAALLAFSGAVIIDRWSALKTGAELRADTALAVSVGELAHALQIERGLSTWSLKSNAADAPELNRARAATDAATSALRQRLSDEDASLNAAQAVRAQLLLQGVAGIDALRQGVSARALSSAEAFSHYCELVDSGLAVINDVARRGAEVSPDVSRSLRLYAVLANGKEYAGRERALGAAALTAPRIRAADLAPVLSLIGAQDAAFQSAPELTENESWRGFLASPEAARFDRLRAEAIGAVGAHADISPAEWFSAASARIDALHALETSQAEQATALVDQSMQATRLDLIGAILISLLSVTGAGAAAVLVARSISRPLEQLTKATHELAKGHLEPAIACADGPKEVLAMSDALNVFRENMRANQALTRELAEADRLASLGALVAGIAHEVNTPVGNALMVATSFGEGVREFQTELASGAVRRSSIDRHLTRSEEAASLLESNLRRASEHIRSFKQVAADQTSNSRRRFDLKKCTEDAVRSCTPVLRQSGVEVELDLEHGVTLDSHPGALTQTLINLIENAVKHGLAGRNDGKVRIASQSLGDGRVRIIVSDNGAGVPDEMTDTIFNAFFTTRAGEGGTGLGLHIVKSIVSGQLGGAVALSRADEGGACFEIVIPCDAPRKGPEAPPAKDLGVAA